MPTRLRADFNGLFGELLCLSHSDTATSDDGSALQLAEGMQVLAFDEDVEDGQDCFLVAKGMAVPSPPWLACNGSKWCLQIDEEGVRHVPSLEDA